MSACNTCPFERRIGREYQEAKDSPKDSEGAISQAAFERMISLSICSSGLEAMSKKEGCEGELSSGDCQFETYLSRRAEELTPVFVERIDYDVKFIMMTRELDLDIKSE